MTRQPALIRAAEATALVGALDQAFGREGVSLPRVRRTPQSVCLGRRPANSMAYGLRPPTGWSTNRWIDIYRAGEPPVHFAN